MSTKSEQKRLVIDIVNQAAAEQTLEFTILKLYSATTYFVLSKEFFSSNEKLSDFVSPLLSALNIHRQKNDLKPIHFGEYVFKSRTILVSRIIRIVQNCDDVEATIIIKQIKLFLKEKPASKPNQVDALLDRFGRTR